MPYAPASFGIPSAPSGCEKDTVLQDVCQRYRSVALSVSSTARFPHPRGACKKAEQLRFASTYDHGIMNDGLAVIVEEAAHILYAVGCRAPLRKTWMDAVNGAFA